MMALIEFWRAHAAELTGMLTRHVALVVIALGVAIAAGVPLGIITARWPRIGRPFVAIASIVQAIPSLALFGFILPLPFIGGVGARTALVALILYGILPILQTTAAGLTSVAPSLIQAATAMGLTSRQRLLLIELPLALPSILAGIRVSAVVGVGTATIAAAIGAGGLGEYIFRGLAMVDPTVILAGAVPAAALALIADGMFAWIGKLAGRRAGPRGAGGRGRRGHEARADITLVDCRRDRGRGRRADRVDGVRHDSFHAAHAAHHRRLEELHRAARAG